MALSKLVADGKCKFIVSTNGDGLHIRSGVPVSNISELHGNSFKYVCKDCNSKWFVFPELDKDKVFHCIAEGTCPGCTGRLHSTGVAFGAELPKDEWEAAKQNSMKCDLALVLGTSLRVSPGNNDSESKNLCSC